MTEIVHLETLLCIEEDHGVQGLFVEKGRHYNLHKDNYGQFIEDDNGEEHYLADFDWESIFMLKVRIYGDITKTKGIPPYNLNTQNLY